MQRLLLGLMRLCVPVRPLLPSTRPALPSCSRSSSAFTGAHKHSSSSQLPLQRGYAAEAAIKEAEIGHLPEGNATSNQSGQQEAEVAEVLSTLEQEDRSVTANELTENQDQESWQDIAARNSEEHSHGGGSGRKKGRLSATHMLSKARLYEDDDHGIRGVHIPRSAWTVLLKLRSAGHEGYIVGGAVRDMLLKGMPKDFDILTSATPAQVRKLLHRSRLVGKRFPIVQVPVGNAMLEVSSFSTGVHLSDLPFDAAALLGNKNAKLGNLATTQGSGLLWKSARQQNAQARDFTVNALFYDPFSRIIFDYTGGVADCRRQTLRTIIDPEASFQQDPARMLRAVRLAARAGLKIEEGTAKAIEKCRKLILGLHSGRVAMEVQALLGYGAAAESMRLLWRLQLLDILFPVLADYLARRKYPRNPRKARREDLFELLGKMDTKARLDAPLPTVVWAAIAMAPVVNEVAIAQGISRPEDFQSTGGESGELRSDMALASSSTDDEVLSSASTTADSGLVDAQIASANGAGSADPTDEASSDLEEEGNSGRDNSQVQEETSSDSNLAPYMQVVAEVINAFTCTESTAHVPVIPRVLKPQILQMLAREEVHRQNPDQREVLKCRHCGICSEVPVHMRAPRCKECGDALPTKALRKWRRPEVLTVLDVLHSAKLPQKQKRQSAG